MTKASLPELGRDVTAIVVYLQMTSLNILVTCELNTCDPQCVSGTPLTDTRF